jgi:hypothetical protein
MPLPSPFAFLIAVICFAATAPASAAETVPLLQPTNLVGKVYVDASLKALLFIFRRTATNNGSTVHVLREFTTPSGKLAARERVRYEAGVLKSYQFEELQTGASGAVAFQPDPAGPPGQKIVFEYTHGKARKRRTETLQPNTLISDNLVPFILDHWNALTNHAVVKCRFVALARAETVEFKLFQESEWTDHGKPVVVLQMEPANWILAQFIEPLKFTVEKEGSHRFQRYSGRTTPFIRRKDKWDDLDAVTVFE